MLWNSLRFVDELDRCGNRYEIENQWYSKAAWGDRNRYVLNAWRLYRCANRSALGMLILGTAKIRKDASLVGNFGFTSAGGLSDPEEQQLVQKLERSRTAVSNAPTVLGQGSVLNDQNWTPLLNECAARVPHRRGHLRTVPALRRCARRVRETEGAAQECSRALAGVLHPASRVAMDERCAAGPGARADRPEDFWVPSAVLPAAAFVRVRRSRPNP